MQNLRASHLADHVGYWLRYVSNHVSQSFARKLEGEGVTVAEWAVLRELFEEAPISPSHLAKRLGLTRGAISKLAERLIVKELVSREDNPDDGRAHSLALTVEGWAIVPALAALADQNDMEYFGHLTTAQREMMSGILREIVGRSDFKGAALN